METLALAYHDVILDGRGDESGFPGADSATYKVALPLFRQHLTAIGEHYDAARLRLALTFDDGGLSAIAYAADELERCGFRGQFFITSGLVGLPGFLERAHVRKLHERGHQIGSHGATHRGKMSKMPADRLAREWNDSANALADMTGARIQLCSVPSGFYAPRVAQAAAAAGLTTIYTQKPTVRVAAESGCEVVGRFTMRGWTTPETVAALVAGTGGVRFRWRAQWQTRQLLKSAGGSLYGDIRRVVFSTRRFFAGAM